MFKYGLISEVKQGFAKVNFSEDEFVSDWLPVLVRKSKSDAESWQLETNEHVICLMDENCNEGVILGAVASDEDPGDSGEAAGKFRKLFSDGTLIEYDKNAGKLTVDVKGDLKAITTGKAEIQAGTNLEATAGVKATVTAIDIELTGNVKITGAVTVLGALSAGSISAAPVAGLPGGISAAGNMTITGNIDVTGEIAGSDVKAGLVSLLAHKHSGVTTGGGVSGPAVP